MIKKLKANLWIITMILVACVALLLAWAIHHGFEVAMKQSIGK